MDKIIVPVPDEAVQSLVDVITGKRQPKIASDLPAWLTLRLVRRRAKEMLKQVPVMRTGEKHVHIEMRALPRTSKRQSVLHKWKPGQQT